EVGAHRTRVDDEQRLTGPNVGAFGVDAPLNDAVDACPYFGCSHRLKPTRYFDSGPDGGCIDNHDTHCGCGGTTSGGTRSASGPGGGFVVAATGKRQQTEDEGERNTHALTTQKGRQEG